MSLYPSTFRIIVSSDNHTGYNEDKPIIGNDSFDGFEEVLEISHDEDVDFILLGGDLFDKSEPSRSTVHKVTSLLRKHVLGDRSITFNFVSEPEEVFCNSKFKRVNFEDENINIGMPIFTIHGNHDDFSGKGLLALDNFHDSGYLNLFGKFTDVDRIKVIPVLLEKGGTKLAIYGIGHQRDDRLCRAFNLGKVDFHLPKDFDDWFKILVLHQNRPPRSMVRSTGSYIPADKIPKFINLVIWGHEHACYVEDLVYSKGDSTYILQPGSTVATSLCPDESISKAAAMLEITGTNMTIKKIPLQRSRQVLYQVLDLGKAYPNYKPPKQRVRTDKEMRDEEYIHKKIEDMLSKAEDMRGPLQPELPRVRLNVVYSGNWLNIPAVKPSKIAERYKNRVANPGELLKIQLKRPEKIKPIEEGIDFKNLTDNTTVFDMLRESIQQRAGEGLGLLQLDELEKMVKEKCYNAKTNSTTKKTALKTMLDEQVNVYMNKINETDLSKFGSHPTSGEIKGFVEFAIKQMIQTNKKHFNADDSLNSLDQSMDNFETQETITQNDENHKSEVIEQEEEEPIPVKNRRTATKNKKESVDVVNDSFEDVITVEDSDDDFPGFVH